jgi:nitrate/TMAO reductase-like tetraheme cytochrome c subunit
LIRRAANAGDLAAPEESRFSGVGASSQGGETMDDRKKDAPKGIIGRVWAWLWRPSARIPLVVLLVVGGIGGILFWGGFNWAMELANTETFCISCHEMRDNPYKELQGTIHFRNRSGVRATCSDCHVPHEWFAKVRRKIQATNELYHKIVGTVNTPEKFEAHRLALARSVWASMKARDSLECRNCHSAAAMDPHKQSQASQVMADAMKNGMTCIDCHKGIAHRLPEEPDEPDESEKSEKK